MVTLLYEQGKKQEWAALSTDTKPTSGVNNGAVLTEIDTGTVYRYDDDTDAWMTPSSGE